jgi:hypothetical protein
VKGIHKNSATPSKDKPTNHGHQTRGRSASKRYRQYIKKIIT